MPACSGRRWGPRMRSRPAQRQARREARDVVGRRGHRARCRTPESPRRRDRGGNRPRRRSGSRSNKTDGRGSPISARGPGAGTVDLQLPVSETQGGVLSGLVGEVFRVGLDADHPQVGVGAVEVGDRGVVVAAAQLFDPLLVVTGESGQGRRGGYLGKRSRPDRRPGLSRRDRQVADPPHGPFRIRAVHGSVVDQHYVVEEQVRGADVVEGDEGLGVDRGDGERPRVPQHSEAPLRLTEQHRAPREPREAIRRGVGAGEDDVRPLVGELQGDERGLL